MTAPVVARGDARRLPLPDASVDLIVTSPPYFALRSYTDGGEHYAGQIGSEPTPAEYIAALVDCTREWVRVLKPSGSIFVNLGDKYADGHGGSSTEGNGVNITVRRNSGPNFRERPDLPNPPASWGRRDATGRNIVPGQRPKSLMLLPERYRIACVDQLGLIARAVLVWSKPNGLPESVTDRVRRSHEDWVHLTKAPRYYAAVDEIREASSQPWRSTGAHDATRMPLLRADEAEQGRRQLTRSGKDVREYNPLGKLPGSVWEIAAEPLKVPDRLAVDHFAAFPSEWPRRLVLGWSPPGVCTVCGEGRRPVVDATPMQWRESPTLAGRNAPGTSRVTMSGTMLAPASRTITGYACACTPYTDHPETDDAKAWREYLTVGWTPPPTTPAVVVDPFGGTGTVAHVAAALGRTGITIDLSADYCRLAAAPELRHARRRKVLGLDKPVVVPVADEQLDLFGSGA